MEHWYRKTDTLQIIVTSQITLQKSYWIWSSIIRKKTEIQVNGQPWTNRNLWEAETKINTKDGKRPEYMNGLSQNECSAVNKMRNWMVPVKGNGDSLCRLPSDIIQSLLCWDHYICMAQKFAVIYAFCILQGRSWNFPWCCSQIVMSPHPPPFRGRPIDFMLSVCPSVRPSRILCTHLSKNYCANVDDTWWGYPLGMSKELIRFWSMWPDFQGHQGSKGQKQKPFLCTQFSPKFFSDFDETSWDYASVVSDELIRFWAMWPNF